MKIKTIVAGSLATLAWSVTFVSLFSCVAPSPNIPDFTIVDGVTPPAFLPRLLSPLSSASDTLDTHVHTVQARIDAVHNDGLFDTQSIAAISRLAPARDAVQTIRNIDFQISTLLTRQLKAEWVFATNWAKHGSLLGCAAGRGNNATPTNSKQFKALIDARIALLTQKVAEAIHTRERIEALTIAIEELALPASIPSALRSVKEHFKHQRPKFTRQVSKSVDSGVGTADEIVRRVRAFREEMLQDEAWFKQHPKALAQLAAEKGEGVIQLAGEGEFGSGFYCRWEGELQNVLREWGKKAYGKSADAKKGTVMTYRLGAYVA